MTEKSSLAELLRRVEESVRSRSRTRRIASLASRFNGVLFFAFDQVFWSRLIRSRRGPVPIELPLKLLRKKGIETDAPVLHVSGLHREVAHWDVGFAGIYAVLFENLKTPNLFSPLRYAQPAPAFRGIYLWDSAFIAQVWKHWNHEVAHEIVLAVIHFRDGDRFQHVVSDFVQSAFTQPPLIAWSLVKIWEGRHLEEIRETFEPLFDILVAYHRWLYQNRQLKNGLFFWEHPYESGMENAPRFSNRSESRLEDTRSLAAPDLSSYMVLQNEALATIAVWLDRDPLPFQQAAAELQEKIRTLLWHEKDGLFYERHVESGAFVPSRSIASLFPLWAGAVDSTQARRVLDHILDPESFNTLLPLPSLALSDPEFSRDMWRGPVWINTAFGAIEGLKRYGFEHEASDFAFRLCDGVYRVYKEDRRFYEFYDPTHLGIDQLHRKKGNRWKAITLGSKPQPNFVGWTGLVNTLVLDQLFGFHRENGLRYVQPRFPERAAGNSYALRLPCEVLSIEITVFGGGEMRVSSRSEKRGLVETRCHFGEKVLLDEVETASDPKP